MKKIRKAGKTMTESFGERMREYRKENFLTQKQLAELTGLSPNHIGTLENGKKKPRASTVAAFEEAVTRENRKRWLPADCGRLMGEDELTLYAQVWRGVRSLEPQREKEVLETFVRILGWL